MITHRCVLAFLLIATGMLLSACLLPGMIPLNSEPAGPMPVMETDADKVIEALNSNNYIPLEALATERYTEEELSKPGRLTYTINLSNDQPTLFGYGWCTTTEEILAQNFEHITVKLSLNGEVLKDNVIHPLSFTRPDGLVCLQYGVLLSEWPAGEYALESVATFDEKINDGLADYEAGDYAFEYNVTVSESAGAATATPNP